MTRLTIIVIIIFASVGSVSSQSPLVINVPIPEGKAQVFTATHDIMPPYTVAGEVNYEFMSAVIYINGIRVVPEYDYPEHSIKAGENGYDKYSQEASILQRQLTTEGYSHENIVDAIADYFRKQPDVLTVTQQDKVTLDIEYRDGQHITRLVTPIKGTFEQGVNMLVNRIRRELEAGKSIVFTSAPTLYVKSCDYDVLVQELSIVRDGAVNDLQIYKWNVLTSQVVSAIIESREDH